MSGPVEPGSPPPEVPEEFAAAYRAAYARALAAQTEGPLHREDSEPDWEAAEDEDDDAVEDPLPERQGELRVGTHRTEDDEYAPTWFERVRDSAWFVPLLLALLALLLILGAYAVGRRFADEMATNSSAEEEPRVLINEGGSDGAKQPVTNQKPGEDAWEGKVARIGNVKAKAQCMSESSVDASGNQVTYDAGNLTDGAADTTWRCDGRAIGERITLKLGKGVAIGQVGLIPGYAKIDDQSQEDRFAENNRVTRVRWTIGDTAVVQRMSGAADDRNLQLIRVPKTTTETVELEILAVKEGPRNTTAISEIQIGKTV